MLQFISLVLFPTSTCPLSCDRFSESVFFFFFDDNFTECAFFLLHHVTGERGHIIQDYLSYNGNFN